ncbi:hypothetical protein Y032_0017g3440 [Ancylostoma ceylanicum]|uniref:Lipid-binding serum glycoprotein N-terminal domain-containing protein n=1 Tax=Ancylostoma ceylanicum TaxID=53326 RepID=A0A016V4L3_9BILA|nr:hypothetical protein Y032_0017g3440 [Ancylostoma ceylanicum]
MQRYTWKGRDGRALRMIEPPNKPITEAVGATRSSYNALHPFCISESYGNGTVYKHNTLHVTIKINGPIPAEKVTDSEKKLKESDSCDPQKSMVKYRVWDGKVNHFSVPQSGVSFMNMNNGIHLSIKSVQFHASVRGRVELGKKVFGKWVRIARMSGDIKAKSENAGMDVKLVWNDFKFIPTVTMNSNVRVDFTHNLKRYLGFLRSKVQKMVTSKVNSEVPKLLIKTINEKVNPRLQKLKQKITEMGITQYGIEWKVQNNILRVILRPKSAIGTPTTVRPMDKMLCIDANILEAVQPLIRQKRRSFFKRIYDKMQSRQEARGKTCTASGNTKTG